MALGGTASVGQRPLWHNGHRRSKACGTLFSIQTDGSVFTNLYTFSDTSNPQAEYPKSGLILVNNLLCGADYTGGAAGCGSVYTIHPDGTGFTPLHEFPFFYYLTNGANSEGALPSGTPILSDNILYGVAAYGGTGGSGSIYALNANGSGFRNLYQFTQVSAVVGGVYVPGNVDGSRPQGSLALSGNTLYGTTSLGGSASSGTVYSINIDGSGFTTLYVFNPYPGGTRDAWGPQCGVVLSPSGNTLYGVAKFGASYGSGAVFAINSDGTGYTLLHEFTGTTPSLTYALIHNVPGYNSDGAQPASPLILSRSGKILYGTTLYGGSGGYGTIFAIRTDGTGFTIINSCAPAVSVESPNVGGDQPNKLLLVGSTLYGTCGEGGTYGQGTVFTLPLGLKASVSATPLICHIGDTITAVVNVVDTDSESSITNVQLAGPLAPNGTGGVSLLDSNAMTIPVLAPLDSGSLTNLFTATNYGTVTFTAAATGVNADGAVTTTLMTSPAVNIVPKGNLLIKRGSDPVSAYAGGGVYQKVPIVPQIETNVVETNLVSTFDVEVANNDSFPLNYTLVAKADNTDCTTQFLIGSQDVTSEITSGMSLPTLQPGETVTVVINSKSLKVSTNGVVVTLGLASDPTVTLDAVQAENVACQVPVTMLLHRFQYDGFVESSILAGKADITAPLQPVSEASLLASQPIVARGVVADEVTPLLIEVQAKASDLGLFPEGRLFGVSASVTGNGSLSGPPVLTQVYDTSTGTWSAGTNFTLSPSNTNAFLWIGPFASDDVQLTDGTELEAAVQVMDQAGASQAGWQPFAIRKPPVFLVHGYSTPGNWDPAFMAYLGLSRPMTQSSDPNNFVVTIHYGAPVVPGYWVNAAMPVYQNTIWSLSECALDLSNQLAVAKNFILQNWALTRYDVVAHSQGGVLSHMLSSQNPNGTIQAPYRNADNFYRGRFHRVITIGSPHNGSRLLHYLMALTTQKCASGTPSLANLYSPNYPLAAITAAATVWAQIAQDKFDPWGPQIQDLNDPSPSGNWYPDPAAQFHLIRAVVDGGNSPGSGDATLAYQFLELTLPGGGQAVIPRGSDGVVDYDSMAANVPPAPLAPNVFDMAPGSPICHAGPNSFFGGLMNETASTAIARHVIDTLDQNGMEDQTDTQFGSFPLPPLLSDDVKQAIDDFACSLLTPTAVQIIQHVTPLDTPKPQDGSASTYYFGLNFPSNEPPGGNVTWFALDYGTNGVSLDDITCVASGTCGSQVTVTVDNSVIGDVVLFAVYPNTNNQMVQALGQLVASQGPPGAALAGIGLLPYSPNMPAGSVIPIQVVAIYSDGTSSVRYLTAGSLAASSSDPAVVSVADPLNWQLLSPGSAQVVVSWSGFSATNQVIVFAPTSDTPKSASREAAGRFSLAGRSGPRTLRSSAIMICWRQSGSQWGLCR